MGNDTCVQRVKWQFKRIFPEFNKQSLHPTTDTIQVKEVIYAYVQ